MTSPSMKKYEDIREGVRGLCAEFDAAYWRGVDERKAFPEEFVDAMTRAGWLAALYTMSCSSLRHSSPF